ncbi:hypothetical protein [Phytohabitans flavus]|nr:hypothetical protein [Phytohabitans flavus]
MVDVSISGTLRSADAQTSKPDAHGNIGRTTDGRCGQIAQNCPDAPFPQAIGFLTARQRKLAWLGFMLVACQAPVAAKVLPDASWLFSIVVALTVATVIMADDSMRRRPAAE